MMGSKHGTKKSSGNGYVIGSTIAWKKFSSPNRTPYLRSYIRAATDRYRKIGYYLLNWDLRSSICIPLLLFHKNSNNVYLRSFSVSLAFVKSSYCKTSKRNQKSRLVFYLENTNHVSVDDYTLFNKRIKRHYKDCLHDI